RLQDSLDFFKRSKNRGHSAVVVHRHLRHSAAASADGFERVNKGERAGGNQGSVFAQAVSHREVGFDAVSGQEAGQREVDCQHGGLSDFGLAQIVFGLGNGVGVGVIDENKF